MRKAQPAKNSYLFISDLHAPYQHPDALRFLDGLNTKYKFENFIGMGDELDYHAMSFHDHDPDLDSAGRELQKGREVMWELEAMFPVIRFVDSNHGSMAYRKAVHNGTPRHLLLNYQDAIFGEKDKHGNLYRPKNRGAGWTWSHSLTLPLPSQQKLKIHHGMSSSTRRNVEQAGMCYAQGHFHGVFELVYHGNSDELNWGMTVGCLIWDEALAFAYNKNTIRRPVIGCGGYVDGSPRLFPMPLRRGGRWTGVVP